MGWEYQWGMKYQIWWIFKLCLQVFLKPNIGPCSMTSKKKLFLYHLSNYLKRQKLHQWFQSCRRVMCGNRVKVSSITSSGESIKPDLHKEGPGLDTCWALFGSHLIRGVGHSNWTPMPSGWLCPALPSSPSFPFTMVNLLPVTQTFLPPKTPSPLCTKGPVHPPCPQSHFIMQWGRSGGRSEYQLHSQVLLMQQGARCDRYSTATSIFQPQSHLASVNISKLNHSRLGLMHCLWNLSDPWGILLYL